MHDRRDVIVSPLRSALRLLLFSIASFSLSLSCFFTFPLFLSFVSTPTPFYLYRCRKWPSKQTAEKFQFVFEGSTLKSCRLSHNELVCIAFIVVEITLANCVACKTYVLTSSSSSSVFFFTFVFFFLFSFSVMIFKDEI